MLTFYSKCEILKFRYKYVENFRNFQIKKFNKSLLNRDSYPRVYHPRYLYSNTADTTDFSSKRNFVYFLLLVQHPSAIRGVSTPSFIRRLSWATICSSRASIGTNCHRVIGGWWSMNDDRWISTDEFLYALEIPIRTRSALILLPRSRFTVRPR